MKWFVSLISIDVHKGGIQDYITISRPDSCKERILNTINKNEETWTHLVFGPIYRMYCITKPDDTSRYKLPCFIIHPHHSAAEQKTTIYIFNRFYLWLRRQYYQVSSLRVDCLLVAQKGYNASSFIFSNLWIQNCTDLKHDN